jgi:hypothetical protein
VKPTNTYYVRVTEANQYFIPVEATSKKEAAEFVVDGYRAAGKEITPEEYASYWINGVCDEGCEEDETTKVCLGIHTVETELEYFTWLEMNGKAKIVDYHAGRTRPATPDDDIEDITYFVESNIQNKKWKEKFNWWDLED